MKRQPYGPWRGAFLAAGLLAGLLSPAPAVRAQAQTVTVDLSPLRGIGTFTFELQLVDGSGTGDNNSAARIENFSLTGGTLGGVLPPLGDVTGSLPAGLLLRDGPAAQQGLADFAQQFTITGASSLLRFDLDLSASGLDTPIPDQFSFLILDSNLIPLPTTGPTGAELVAATFTSPTPLPVAYSTTGTPRLAASVSPASPVPEASGAVSLAALLIGGLLTARRRR